jgi:hypothetical protein
LHIDKNYTIKLVRYSVDFRPGKKLQATRIMMIEQNEANRYRGDSSTESKGEDCDVGSMKSTDDTSSLLRSLQMELQQQREVMTRQHEKMEKRYEQMEMRLGDVHSLMTRIEKLLSGGSSHTTMRSPPARFEDGNSENFVASDYSSAAARPLYNMTKAERRKKLEEPIKEKEITAELCFPSWMDLNRTGDFSCCGPDITKEMHANGAPALRPWPHRDVPPGPPGPPGPPMRP